MDLNRERAMFLTRRQFFGRTAAGVGTAALASLLNPPLVSGAAAAAALVNNCGLSSDASAAVPIPAAVRPKNCRRVRSNARSRFRSIRSLCLHR